MPPIASATIATDQPQRAIERLVIDLYRFTNGVALNLEREAHSPRGPRPSGPFSYMLGLWCPILR